VAGGLYKIGVGSWGKELGRGKGADWSGKTASIHIYIYKAFCVSVLFVCLLSTRERVGRLSPDF